MIDTATQKLLDSGILGALCVILLSAVFYLFTLLMKEKDRYSDLLREMLQRDTDHLSTMKEALGFVKDVSK